MAGPYKRTRAPKNAPIEDRLRLHMIEAPSGCWIWTGARNEFGYGRITVNKRLLYAHRVAYETFVGPIPAGLQLDHLCRRPACIKPLHLQPVTPQVNVLRGTSPGARAQRRDRCLRGHLYAEHGHQYRGRRYCRGCMTLHNQARGAARKALRDAQADVLAELIDVRNGSAA